MAHFEDLSNYSYAPGFVFPRTKNVGWLARGHTFPTAAPDEDVLDLLWSYCSISVVPTRGGHDCEFCAVGSARHFERNGQRLLLGTAEIRVFSRDGQIYAAPTLIYHYMAAHHYKPPDEFLQALRDGLRPSSQQYFDVLAKQGLEWTRTSKGPPRDRVVLEEPLGPNDRNYLDRLGTLSDIKRTSLELEEGSTIRFYRRDRNHTDREDYLLFEGVIHFDAEKRQWYTIIDEGSYRHETDFGSGPDQLSTIGANP